jgi:uncharacterized protein (TIGR00725 family)
MTQGSKRNSDGAMKIGVYGSWRTPIPESTLQWARELGLAIARAGHILVTGGSGGTLLAAREGCRTGGGLNVGIIPESHSPLTIRRRALIDVGIPTGSGALGRMPILANTIDIAFALGGGAGTLVEVALTYLQRKPMFLVEGLEKKRTPSLTRLLVRRRQLSVGRHQFECGWLDGKEENLVAPIFIFPHDLVPREALRFAITLASEVQQSRSAIALGPLDE